MGNILEVDLSNGHIKQHKLKKELIKYIGGRGFGARLLWDLTNSHTDPLSGENPFIMATGPLLGALVPGAGKTSFTSLSPATEIYADSNIGGLIGLRLKQSNNDILIIKGSSKKPVIISIFDSEVKILPGESYWGMSTFEAEKSIKDDLGDNLFEVLTIGVAGENLVRCANIQTRHRHAGRTGMGAVLGSKKLKGIAINGTHTLHFSDTKKLLNTFKIANSYLTNHPFIKVWHKRGTMGLLEDVGVKELLPVNNFKDSTYRHYMEIGGEMFENTYPDQITQTCLFCGIACEGVVKINGKIQVRPQYENVAMLGPNCGITDLEHILKSNYLCDYYGIDTISVGNLVALAMECYENNIIPKDEFHGLKLEFGSKDGMHELIKAIAENRGIGKYFSLGIKNFIKRWPQSEKFAMHCKGLEQSGYDTRSLIGMTLAYATCDIGAHHNRAWVAYHEMMNHPDDHSIAKLVSFHQHIRPLMDCLGVCRFPWIEFNIDINLYADFYSAATGISTNIEELLFKSEMIYNLTRAINVRRGISRKDDYPPSRVFDDPVPDGIYKGRKIDRNRFEEILNIYYDLRGWDKLGIPTKEYLEKFSLNFTINEVEKIRNSLNH